jgi:hypothetical protein
MPANANEKIIRASRYLEENSHLRQRAELMLTDSSAKIENLQPILDALSKL